MFDGKVTSDKFKRNPELIKTLFKNKGDSIVANDDFYIIFPDRYTNKKLAVMGPVVKLLSIFAVVDKKGNLGVIYAPVFIDILPSNVKEVIIDGTVNKVLEIEKGNVFVTNRNLLKIESFMYNVFDEFFLQGKVPWFVTEDMLSDIYSEASKYAGSNIGSDPLAMELIAAIITRYEDDKRVPYRLVKTKKNAKPTYVGLNNVYYAFDNTLAKVMGGYMRQGITTAIVNPEDKTSKVSGLLRA